MKKLIQISILTIAFLALWGKGAYAQNIVVIVHPSSDLKSVTASAIAKLFMGKSKSIDKAKLTPVDQTTKSEAREGFSVKLLGRSIDKIVKYWKKKTFAGKGKAPKLFGSDKEVIAHVSETPGAIGYVSADAVVDNVKVLIVDGQKEW